MFVLFLVSGIAVAKSEPELLPIVEGGLCQPGEIEVASCMLEGKGRKFVSICADQQKKQASYYFGLKNNIELKVGFSSGKKLYRWLNSDTYAVFLGFNRGGYSYILEIPQETYGARATLYVKKSNELFAYDSPSRRCTNNAFGEKDLIVDAIEDVTDKSVRDAGFLFPPNK